MGVGLSTCASTCCVPDALSFRGKMQDDAIGGKHGCATEASSINLAVGVPDELGPVGDKGNMLVFRDDRPPEMSGTPCGTPRSGRRAQGGAAEFATAVDSCTMLNDLDFLATPEWQTMPPTNPSELEEKMLKEAETASLDKVYNVALKALWHNCPDALEVGLRRAEGSPLSEDQARDKRFMAQKLEFTRIRQRFVALCMDFHGSGAPTEASKSSLRSGVAEVEERCTKLMAAQPDEQMTQLPGLIGKRDTLMLQTRIRTIAAKLFESSGK